jgi:diaminopimelate epimerase
MPIIHAMDVRFTKMQGTGNDFILIDEWSGLQVPEAEKEDFVKRACARHFGIGSDGLIFAQKSEKADMFFGYYNPDGSKAEMCGNGIRCLAKYAYEHGLVEKAHMRIDTHAGVKDLDLEILEDVVLEVKVDMGKPQIKRAEAQVSGEPDDTFIAQRIDVHGFEYTITSVGMGNPHAILFYEDINSLDVKNMGERIRNHTQLFPNGVNVHFIEKAGENKFKIRTYERGVEDETLACGTGICASAVAAVLTERADIKEPIEFQARSGKLKIELKGSKTKPEKAHLIGPAEEVFNGTIRV